VNSTGRGLMELSAGSRLVLAGAWWQVRGLEPHTGRVLLRRDGGQELATTIRALVNRSDCRPAPAAVAACRIAGDGNRPGWRISPPGSGSWSPRATRT
jgi:hypothetical protein